MSLPWRKPLIFAHRGASAYAPENTLAAFNLAIRQNADVIEVDAKLSSDEHVVIIHDQTVDRTTNGAGRVDDLPLAELRKLDAGSYFKLAFQGESIPTLDDVLETCAGRIIINIELTNYLTPFDPLPVKVAQIINKHGQTNRILVSSFHPLPLRRFHTLLPRVPIGFLARRGYSGALSRSWFGKTIVPYQALHPEKSDVSRALVSNAHQSDKRVHTFTVNSPEEMLRLLSLGVDGIITDDPLAACQVTDAFSSTNNN